MKVSVIGPVMSVLRSFFLSLFLFPDLGRSICLNGCDGAGAGIVCNKDRAELSNNPGDDVNSHLAINLLLLQPALGSSFVELFLDDGEEVLAFSIMGNK